MSNYSDSLNSTEAQAVADIVRKHVEAKTINLGTDGGTPDAQVVALPAGIELKSIKPFVDEYRTAPERRKGTAALLDLASFIDHANRFKDGGSVIFASRTGNDVSLTSVLDYHPAGAASEPRLGTHRGLYKFPVSDEWKVWTANNAKALAQAVRLDNESVCALERVARRMLLLEAHDRRGVTSADVTGPRIP